MQPERHEALLDVRQVMANLMDQQLVVDLFEIYTARRQRIGHRLTQLRLQARSAHQRLDLGNGRAPGRPSLLPVPASKLDELAQLEQVVIQRRRDQRRRQMVDHHRQPPALGLDPLAHAIDDVGVNTRQVTDDLHRIILRAQSRPAARQELVGRVPAQMHQRVGTKLVA